MSGPVTQLVDAPLRGMVGKASARLAVLSSRDGGHGYLRLRRSARMAAVAVSLLDVLYKQHSTLRAFPCFGLLRVAKPDCSDRTGPATIDRTGLCKRWSRIVRGRAPLGLAVRKIGRRIFRRFDLVSCLRNNKVNGPVATPAMMRKPSCVSHSARNHTDAASRWHPRPAGRALHELSPIACLLSTPPLIAILTLLLAGCAMQPSAPAPIQIQTRTVEVKVPTPVPCFKEEDRPIMPTPTPINLQTATIDQMAAAIDADALADSIFTAAVDRLFIQCQKAGGTP